MNFAKLSIIVPNYNQGAYIEETLLSIINQNYTNLELIVIDGGSTDNSVDVIKKYEKYIDYWVSEKDGGQAHAINKGYAKATGDYIAWMNADDTYLPNALSTIFSLPEITGYDFIYGPVCSGRTTSDIINIEASKNEPFSLSRLLLFFYSIDYIVPSQSVFVKRSFLEINNIKFLDESFHFCMDLEWYCRIAIASPKYYKYKKALSFFRINESTKTGSPKNGIQQEAVQAFLNYRKYLRHSEANKIFDALYFHRLLPKLYKGSVKRSIISLLTISCKIPMVLKDKRFLGLLKMQLTNRN